MKSVALFAVMPSTPIAGLVCPAHAAPCTALTFECLYPPFLGTEIPGVRQHVAPTSPAAYHEAGHAKLSSIKSGRITRIRFSKFESICKHLRCQPGEIPKYPSQGNDEMQGLAKTG